MKIKLTEDQIDEIGAEWLSSIGKDFVAGLHVSGDTLLASIENSRSTRKEFKVEFSIRKAVESMIRLPEEEGALESDRKNMETAESEFLKCAALCRKWLDDPANE